MATLRQADESDLEILATWLHNAEEARVWGGPSITFPVLMVSLKQQIQWGTHQSFAMLQDDELVGFAQIAKRFGNHHLCRVLIDPKMRGQQFGEKLLGLIFLDTTLVTNDYSLFVYEDNKIAINLYRKWNFIDSPHPAGVSNMGGCLYMVRRHLACT